MKMFTKKEAESIESLYNKVCDLVHRIEDRRGVDGCAMEDESEVLYHLIGARIHLDDSFRLVRESREEQQ
jgi:hypothetical protein